MSERNGKNDADDFDAELAAVERFISDVQQGSVPTGAAMRSYRDEHRPAIERLRARLAEFEALLDATSPGDGPASAQAVGGSGPDEADEMGPSSIGSA